MKIWCKLFKGKSSGPSAGYEYGLESTTYGRGHTSGGLGKVLPAVSAEAGRG